MRASTPAMIYLNNVTLDENNGTCLISLSLFVGADDDEAIRGLSHLDLSCVIVLSINCGIATNFPFDAPQVTSN